MPQYFTPATDLWKHLNVPSREIRVQEEAVRQLTVGIVLRKDKHVRLILIHAHDSKSPCTNALITSPFTIWLRGRTVVGSRWLFRTRTNVFSSEKRRTASGLWDVAMNWPADWKPLRRAITK